MAKRRAGPSGAARAAFRTSTRGLVSRVPAGRVFLSGRARAGRDPFARAAGAGSAGSGVAARESVMTTTELRFEFHDPFAEATYNLPTFEAAAVIAVEMGGSIVVEVEAADRGCAALAVAGQDLAGRNHRAETVRRAAVFGAVRRRFARDRATSPAQSWRRPPNPGPPWPVRALPARHLFSWSRGESKRSRPVVPTCPLRNPPARPVRRRENSRRRNRPSAAPGRRSLRTRTSVRCCPRPASDPRRPCPKGHRFLAGHSSP